MSKGRFFRGGGAEHQEEVVGQGELETDEILGVDEEGAGEGLMWALQGEFAVVGGEEGGRERGRVRKELIREGGGGREGGTNKALTQTA